MEKEMNLVQIPIGRIITEGQLIRAGMDDDHVIELANSIAKVGLLQPIVVKVVGKGQFQLLAGAHRLAACKRLHWTHIPAVIKNTEEDEPTKGIALIENIIRKDMSLQEECEAIRVLTEEQNMSISQVCQLLGRSREWINKRLAAPNLPENVKEALFDGLISMAAAELIASVEDEGARGYILNEAIYAKRTLFEIRTMAETLKVTPSVTQAVEQGLKTAQELSTTRAPKKVCEFGDEVVPMHEMRVLWLCGKCYKDIMEIKEAMFNAQEKGGENNDTEGEDRDRQNEQDCRDAGVECYGNRYQN